MSMGSSLKVKAVGLSFKYLKILLVLLSAILKVIMEENLKEYLGHSTRRCDCDWNSLRHVHPCSSCGKKCWLYSPVGAWPETSLVKWLNIVISEARRLNCFPLPSHALGIKSHFFFFFSFRAFKSANAAHAVHHSVITRDQLIRSLEASV